MNRLLPAAAVIAGALCKIVKVEFALVHLAERLIGDLIEALNRAIRQALFKTKTVLLEPYYLVCLKADPSQGLPLREATSENIFATPSRLSTAGRRCSW